MLPNSMDVDQKVDDNDLNPNPIPINSSDAKDNNMDIDNQQPIDPNQPTTNTPNPNPTTNQPQQQDIDLNAITIWKAKWNKKEYGVYFDQLTKLCDIKEQLEDETGVRKEKIKLIGFKYKKKYKNQNKNIKISDNTLMHYLQCKSKKDTFMMIGTLDKHAFNDADIICNDFNVIDDFDLNYSLNTNHITKNQNQNLIKLEKSIRETTINEIFSPRKGKKLLVLDIDYTIFDMGSKTENWSSLKRPFADYMMEKCYNDYDIVIWSQTSWRWIEIKLTEMNMLTNDKYNITFVLDKKCMFTITSQFKNGAKKHYVKPLGLIWAKFKGIYDESNTIHIDDLSRNFAMNMQQGLTIKPYKKAYKNKHTDKELLYLTHYLLLIAKLNDFRSLDHNKWKEYLEKHGDDFINDDNNQ